MGSYRLGVDIGGTVTNAVMMDEATGEISLVKMASTPQDPSVGFMSVVERALRERGVDAADVSYIVHGTTVVTNTIIEGKGARAALISTEGFRDVFEIARQIRPKRYDKFCEKPPPLVPRYLCYGVPERDVDKVLSDVIDGKVTPERAREVYGVVIDVEKREVDLEATEKLRERR